MIQLAGGIMLISIMPFDTHVDHRQGERQRICQILIEKGRPQLWGHSSWSKFSGSLDLVLIYDCNGFWVETQMIMFWPQTLISSS